MVTRFFWGVAKLVVIINIPLQTHNIQIRQTLEHPA
jgi:hypothetical protein